MKKLMLASLLAVLAGANVAQALQSTFKFVSDAPNQERVAYAKVVIREYDKQGIKVNTIVKTLNPGDDKTDPIAFRKGSLIILVAIGPDNKIARRLDGTKMRKYVFNERVGMDWTFHYLDYHDNTGRSGTSR